MEYMKRIGDGVVGKREGWSTLVRVVFITTGLALSPSS